MSSTKFTISKGICPTEKVILAFLERKESLILQNIMFFNTKKFFSRPNFFLDKKEKKVKIFLQKNLFTKEAYV
jgi:hypothetical protein